MKKNNLLELPREQRAGFAEQRWGSRQSLLYTCILHCPVLLV